MRAASSGLTVEWYADLVNKHASKLLGQKDGRDVQAGWWEVFVEQGYSCDELEAAFEAMAADPQRPEWREKQLAYIQKHIASARLVAMHKRKLAKQSESRSECEKCKDMGIVVVPHLRAIDNGEWLAPYVTFGVACDCPVGYRTHTVTRSEDGEYKKVPPILGIRDYAARNPRWRQQIQERDRAQESLRAAALEASGVDKLLGRIQSIGRMPAND